MTDDVLYGIDTERWLPDNNPRAHEISREGYPWFGDEMEILLNASNKWKDDENAAGNGFSWQMVCNLTKSQLHNTNVGGILAGEPRRSPDAWNTYVGWIEHGDQTCAVKPRKGGYVLEWRIAFHPCVEIEPGVFYSPTMGDKPVGLNIALGDLDQKERRRQFRQLPPRRLVGRREGQAHGTATLGDVMDPIEQAPVETYESLTSLMELTLLAPNLTADDVDEGCRTAREYGIAAVVVRPCDVEMVSRWMAGSAVKVASVAGYPYGISTTGAKLYEGRDLIRLGVRELDFVLEFGGDDLAAIPACRDRADADSSLGA